MLEVATAAAFCHPLFFSTAPELYHGTACHLYLQQASAGWWSFAVKELWALWDNIYDYLCLLL
jgi:hypothetical protein